MRSGLGSKPMLSNNCTSRSANACQCPVCPHLFGKTAQIKIPSVRRRTFSASKSIVREFEPMSGLCFVVSGMAKVSEYTHSGEQLIKKFVFPGEFIKMHPWPATLSGNVVALTDVQVCDIDYQWGIHNEIAFPEIDRALLAAAIGESNHNEFWQRILISKNPIDRLIFFLVDVAVRSTRPNGRERLIELPMTRADIADYLGLQRETVSRSFSELRSSGHIVCLNRDTCVIKDFEHFRTLVDCD